MVFNAHSCTHKNIICTLTHTQLLQIAHVIKFCNVFAHAHTKMSAKYTHTKIVILILCHNAQTRYTQTHNQFMLRSHCCKAIWSIKSSTQASTSKVKVTEKQEKQRCSQRFIIKGKGTGEVTVTVTVKIKVTIQGGCCRSNQAHSSYSSYPVTCSHHA